MSRVVSASLFAAVILVAGTAHGQSCLPERDLALAGKMTGAVTEANCTLPDGSSYVEYRLTTPVRGTWDASVSSAEVTPVIWVRDRAGHKLESGAAVHVALERGEYLVWVNVKAGESGAFALESAFTPEPGLWCDGFPFIGTADVAAGRLAPSSCRLPDGSHYDAYRLTPQTSGTLQAALEDAEFPGLLILRDSDGSALAVDAVSLSADVDAGSEYTLVVATSDASGAGAYRLVTALSADTGAACRPVASLTGTDHLVGVVDDSGCSASETSRYNYYTFSTQESGTVDLRLASPDSFVRLEILDARGRLLAAWDDGGNARTSLIHQQVRPGDYFIRAYSSGDPPGGNYSLDFTFRPGLPERCPVFTLVSGSVTAGTLSLASACRTVSGAGDMYEFQLGSAATVEIALASANFDAALALRDAKGNVLAVNEDDGGGTDSRLSASLPAGTYSVLALTRRGAGRYTVSLRVTAPGAPPCPGPAALGINSGISSVLNADSCRGADGQAVSYHEFAIPAGGTTAVVVRSLDFASSLAVEAAGGTVLRRDAGSFGNGNSLILQYLPEGTYRAAVRSLEPSPGGPYRIDLLFATGEQGLACAPIRDLALVDTITTRLDFVNCEWPGGTFASVYRLPVTEPAALRIEMTSPDFEAVIRLLDSRGNLVEESYAGVRGATARINRYFDAGVYYIVVRSGEKYATGSYSLVLPAPS